MKIIVDMPKEVIDFFEQMGIIVDEIDGSRYYNLPEWYKKEQNGVITEILFNELPDQCKHIHLSYRDYQRVFTLDEMKDSWEAGANDMFNTHLGDADTPDKKQYFLDKFGIDISDMKK